MSLIARHPEQFADSVAPGAAISAAASRGDHPADSYVQARAGVCDPMDGGFPYDVIPLRERDGYVDIVRIMCADAAYERYISRAEVQS